MKRIQGGLGGCEERQQPLTMAIRGRLVHSNESRMKIQLNCLPSSILRLLKEVSLFDEVISEITPMSYVYFKHFEREIICCFFRLLQ